MPPMIKTMLAKITATSLVGAFAFAATTATAQDEAMSPTTTENESAEGISAKDQKYINLIGWSIGSQIGQMPLNQAEKEILIAGISSALRGEGPPEAAREISQQQLQEYLSEKAAAAQEVRQKEMEDRRQKLIAEHAEEAEANRAKGKEYMEQLGEEWEQLPSGVYYKIIEKGEEPMLSDDDVAMVNYEGRLVDGTVFDSSEEGQPAAFPLQGVIPGFRQGLKQIGKGGKIELVIPDDQAYGGVPTGSIPAGSTLVFEISVEDVQAMPTRRRAPPQSSARQAE